MNQYKKFVFIVIFAPILPILSVLLLLYLYDPFQIWHKPYWRDTTFFTLSEHSRMQNKAVIDFYDFDSIIIGSSMMFNTSFKETQDKLGGKWVNLSMSGGQMNDKAIILKYALQRKNIKNIITSLDQIDSVTNRDSSSFDYLYDNDSINNMKLYINFKFIGCALIWSSSPNCIGSNKEYQQYSPIVTQLNKTTKEQGEIDWITREHNKDSLKSILIASNRTFPPSYTQTIDMEAHKKYLNENLFYMVSKYPNTKFHFIIPAYSRLTYKSYQSYYISNFYVWISTIKYIINRGKDYPNMFVYGFDNLDYADNLGNYFDFNHHKADMNSMQIDAIKNKTHILTPNNIESYLDTMEQKIKDYDLKPLVKIINEYTKK